MSGLWELNDCRRAMTCVNMDNVATMNVAPITSSQGYVSELGNDCGRNMIASIPPTAKAGQPSRKAAVFLRMVKTSCANVAVINANPIAAWFADIPPRAPTVRADHHFV
jgi:hypothetical protein